MKLYEWARANVRPRSDAASAQPEMALPPTQQMALDLQQSAGNAALVSTLANRGRTAAPEGSRLPAGIRAKLERAFGEDLSAVKIHTGSVADSLARDLGARAFTSGDDVYFRHSAFDPTSKDGMRTLAHEVAHVLQQRGGVSQNSQSRDAQDHQSRDAQVQVSQADDRSERTAREVGNSVAAGERPKAGLKRGVGRGLGIGSIPTGVIQREEEPGLLGSLWNIATNNAISGSAGIVEKAAGTSASSSRLLEAIRGPAAASSQMPGLGPTSQLGGSSVLSSVLAPLGLAASGKGLYDAFSSPQFGKNYENTESIVTNTLGLFSSGVGTMGLAGSGLTAAGATGAGGALTGAAAAAGPAAAVAGSAAGGYALGRALDNVVGWGLGKTGLGNVFDRWEGVERAPGQSRDVSLSGMGGDAMYAIDRGVSSLWRDESKPEYTQTLGWKLAEALPSWLQ